ncbi:MAG: glutamate--tRNA ligase [Legionella sp.]|nr:MAG: glutamate--tRNA ligase [Legionella sp.]
MQVRTRFAPSPTGLLHVGGVRTALYSWLFARHHQGQFILRIEDTDQERSTQASVAAIIDGMAWLGLNYDEEVVYQTQRYPRYAEVIEQLLQEGKAYRCRCSTERLDALREKQLSEKIKPRYDGHCRELQLEAGDTPFVVRLRNPQQGTVHFQDQVYGSITVHNEELDDLILVRSDGHPTYNFAVVIDDWDMGITHVIRGDDHINNTPRQINLYTALGVVPPVFAHLPMILGEDGKRLSKRHGAVSVLQFKEEGFLPHALLNYLVRLGWSHGDQEIFSLEQMIAEFDLSAVSRGVAGFNYDKLLWLNQHYLKHDAVDDVAKALAFQFQQAGIDVTQGPDLEAIVALQADRCKTLVEMCHNSRYFYEDTFVYDTDAQQKFITEDAIELLREFRISLQSLDDWQREPLHHCLKEFVKEKNIGFGHLAQPLRVVMTGSTMSPSMDATLELIGKKRVLERLDRVCHL